MSFVFKGDAAHWDADQGDRIFQGISTIRIESATRLVNVGPGVNIMPIPEGDDLSIGEPINFVTGFIFRIDSQSSGDFIEDLVLRQPGATQDTDQYRIQIAGEPVDYPIIGAPISDYFGQFGQNISNPERAALDLAQADTIQYLGETDTSLLTGTGEERADRAQSIAYLYEAGLDRDGAIDEGGLNFWIDAAGDGLTQRQIAQAFIASPEFAASFGAPETLTEEDYVRQLYRNVLNREADQAGFNFWFGVLEDVGGRRDELLIAFAESDENLTNSTFVEDLAETLSGIWEFPA